MGRVHIPFRFGEACGLSAGAIRQLAQEARKLAIDLDDQVPGTYAGPCRHGLSLHLGDEDAVLAVEPESLGNLVRQFLHGDAEFLGLPGFLR